MIDGKPYVMCPNCSGRIGTARSAEEAEVTCKKCSADLRYWVKGSRVTVEIMSTKGKSA